LAMNKADCQKIKCGDYLADGGEPAWCLRAGCPAVVAVLKCPKVSDEKREDKQDGGNGKKI
jgi:hypothetical protein